MKKLLYIILLFTTSLFAQVGVITFECNNEIITVQLSEILNNPNATIDWNGDGFINESDYIMFLSQQYDCEEEGQDSLTLCEQAQFNATGLIGEFVPQCEDDGSFASTQCWGSTGYCWCVDENGVEIPGTAIPSWIGMPDCLAQMTDVTFLVDMNTQPISPDGVHLAGSFQNWDPSASMMSDNDADGVYELTLALDQDSTYEYKFVNGNEWGSDESLFVGDCATPVDGNRTLTTALDSTITLDLVCFGSCDPCPAVAQTLTFKLDMSLENVSPFGVHVAGDFQGWDPSATELLDEDGDNVYEVTLTGDFSGDYEYKFINGNDWGDDEQFSGDCINANQNRVFSVTSATTLVGPLCYEECGPCIMPDSLTLSEAQIWSNDFSDPTTWIIDHDASACNLDWEIDTNLYCEGSLVLSH